MSGDIDVLAGIWNSRRREIDHPLSQNPSHPDLFDNPGHFVLQEISSAKSRSAGEQHLRTGQKRSQAYIFRVYPGSFGRKNMMAQPLIQRQIIGKPPEKRHGHVGVGVDQAGHY